MRGGGLRTRWPSLGRRAAQPGVPGPSPGGSTRDRLGARALLTVQPSTVGLLGAGALMTVAAFLPLEPLRAVIVVPVALLAPGAGVLLLTLGPRRRLDAPIAVSLSALLSMATYGLLSLALYAASVKLTRANLLVSTDALIAVLAFGVELADTSSVSGYRRGALGGRVRRSLSSARPGLLFATLIAIVVGAVAATHSALPGSAPTPYSAIYLTGSSAHIDSSQTLLEGRAAVVHVGIANQTGRSRSERLVSYVDLRRGSQSTDVAIPAGGKVVRTVRAPLPQDGCLHRLSVSLAPSGRTAEEHSIDVWVRAAGPTIPLCLR